MFYNNHPTIAVIISDVDAYFQEHLCKTISSYGKALGYNIAFFTGYTSYGKNTKNSKGELNLYNLPPYEQFDGFILCPDTFWEQYELIKQLYKRIKKSTDAPIVCIRRQLEDSPSILIDDSNSIKKIVEHFYFEHHFRRIAFMAGPKVHPDAIARHEAYKSALQELGIAYDESLVFEGDFWKGKSAEAAHYFTKELDVLPEAIICANDHMAISLSNELILSGYTVPGDIAITGFDDIEEASTTMPPLTTVTIPIEMMAQKSLDLLINLINKNDVEPVQYLATKVVLRNTCGCSTFSMDDMVLTHVKQHEEYEATSNQTLYNTFTSTALQNLTTGTSIGYYLHLLDYEDNNFMDFHICLGESKRVTTYPKYASNKPGYAKYSTSIYSFVNREQITTTTFKTSNLIPPEAAKEEPVSYFFFSLHYLEFCLGYIAISYKNDFSKGRAFESWLTIISNSLENLRVRNKNEKLLTQLNSLYVEDALTGLYNRRGFEQFSSILFQTAKKKNRTIIVIGMDMDDLKGINDKYGHQHGDLALKAIANALKSSAMSNEICARVGGDEFSVIGIDYDEEKAKQFIDNFYAYLEKYNKGSHNNYNVSASYGYTLSSEDGTEHMTLEEFINLSDNRLYEQKRKKKRNQS